MQFVEATRMYYDSTGDLSFVGEVWPVILAQLAYFSQRVINNSTGGPGTLANGLLLAREYTSFDDPLAYVQVQGGALNAFYTKSLMDSAYLADALNDTFHAASFTAAAASLKSVFNDALWNSTCG